MPTDKVAPTDKRDLDFNGKILSTVQTNRIPNDVLLLGDIRRVCVRVGRDECVEPTLPRNV